VPVTALTQTQVAIPAPVVPAVVNDANVHVPPAGAVAPPDDRLDGLKIVPVYTYRPPVPVGTDTEALDAPPDPLLVVVLECVGAVPITTVTGAGTPSRRTVMTRRDPR